jgi:hypothetical protein
MSERAQVIACLNDQLRMTLQGGRVFVTSGIESLGEDAVAKVLERVRTFEAFSADNDPYGEHDFGVIDDCGPKIFLEDRLLRSRTHVSLP